MQKRRLIPLFSPGNGRIARVCLLALSALLFSFPVYAQAEGDGLPDKREYNKDVRTKTWSIYVQGGLSWANGVWYESINAKKSYDLSPSVGGGVDFTLRPWVRFGAEYLWSRYRREQQTSSLETGKMPIKAYGNYLMNYHNVKLGAGFNVLELWSGRGSQRFNIWLGTGVGYMMAKGNEYGIYFNTTVTQNGTSTPVTGDINIDNSSSVSVQGNVKTTNEHSSFDHFYLPASLQVEYDLTRQFTLGVKGEMDWLLNRKSIAPESLTLGMVTLRYNFVAGKAKKMKAYYDSRMSALDAELAAALRNAEAEKARAERTEAERQRLARENADLQARLNDCEQSKANMEVKQSKHIVLFANNSSYFSEEEAAALKVFAEQHRGKVLSLVAEASKPGSTEYNQRLSERRLSRVVKALEELGFSANNLKPRVAIGSQRGIASDDARRVTITVE